MEILLVDDNDITREIQQTMLESCGLLVAAVDCGGEAVRIAGEKQFFLIFMDICMPDMDGFRTAEIIRENGCSAPIIALSADKISRDDARFVKSGMNDALLKPLQMSELKELLEKYIAIEMPGEKEDEDADTLFACDELLAVMKNEKAALRLLDRFLNIHGGDCAKLCADVRNGNYQGAREILHNIVGISGNMFCKRLYGIACTLGSELRQNYCESLDLFSGIWHDTVRELKLRRNILRETASENANDISWQELWDRFYSLCDDFDVYAAELFYENINRFKESMSGQAFEKLKRAVMAYDFLEIISDREVYGNV